MQQIINDQNHVHFKGQNRKQLRFSDSNSLQSLKQKTLDDIDPIQNNHIEITGEAWDIQIVKEKLQKLVTFLRFHNVQQSQVWNAKKQLSVNQFANVINQNYGYHLTNHELAGLLRLSTRKQFLRPKDFAPLGLWLEEISSTKFSRYFNNQNSQKTKINKLQKSINQRKFKSNQTDDSSLQNLQISQNQVSKLRKTYKQPINATKSYTKQTFKQAQKYSQAKIQLKVQELKKDIKESVLEKKWDFIVMAGEMNQWIEQLKKKNLKRTFFNSFLTINLLPLQSAEQGSCKNSSTKYRNRNIRVNSSRSFHKKISDIEEKDGEGVKQQEQSKGNSFDGFGGQRQIQQKQPYQQDQSKRSRVELCAFTNYANEKHVSVAKQHPQGSKNQLLIWCMVVLKIL